ATIVEVVRRNLRSEIRHELLNVSIRSTSQLKEVCRRRKRFLEEIRHESSFCKPGYSKKANADGFRREDRGHHRNYPAGKAVAELNEGMEMEDAGEFSDEGDPYIEAVALICWNCRKEGHRYKEADKRPFAEVYLLGEKVLGLLDMGAAISCLGGRLAERFIQSGAEFKRKGSCVRTADGQRQQVLGQVTTEIKFKGQCKKQSLYLIEAIRYKEADKRPFAEVYLLGEKVLGLLDMGAAISCLGGRLAERFIQSGAEFKRKGSCVRTADGQRQQVLGQVTTEIKFKGQC
ncbi:hypothetical protein KR074_012449, partial [Drosophila pseudoananassae]